MVMYNKLIMIFYFTIHQVKELLDMHGNRFGVEALEEKENRMKINKYM